MSKSAKEPVPQSCVQYDSVSDLSYFLKCSECGCKISNIDPYLLTKQARERGWVYDYKNGEVYCGACKTKLKSSMRRALRVVKPFCNGRWSFKKRTQFYKISNRKKVAMNSLYIDTAIYNGVLYPDRFIQEWMEDYRRDLEQFMRGEGINEFDIFAYYLPHSPRRGYLTVHFVGVEKGDPEGVKE